jgi:pimeloyl-ACP methyl ester carboxylesterase
MAANRFASIDRIGRISMPKLLLHAVDDAVIPVSHGRALCAAASAPKECVEFPRGGHMDAFRDNPEFWDRAPAFVARVTAPGPTGESPPPIIPPASH